MSIFNHDKAELSINKINFLIILKCRLRESKRNLLTWERTRQLTVQQALSMKKISSIGKQQSWDLKTLLTRVAYSSWTSISQQITLLNPLKLILLQGFTIQISTKMVPFALISWKISGPLHWQFQKVITLHLSNKYSFAFNFITSHRP